MSVFWLCFSHCFPTSDTTTQAKADTKDFWVNMPNLISHLKKVAEQKPQATYYNVDMLKYQVNFILGKRCELHSSHCFSGKADFAKH